MGITGKLSYTTLILRVQAICDKKTTRPDLRLFAAKIRFFTVNRFCQALPCATVDIILFGLD